MLKFTMVISFSNDFREVIIFRLLVKLSTFIFCKNDKYKKQLVPLKK